MKVTIIRDKGEREVVNREELIGLAGLIQKGWREKSVLHLRELYHLITVERQEDGRVKTNLKGGIQLERICFASEFDNYRGERRKLGYNGLVVLEKNGLETYEQAVDIRNKVSRMPQTVMAFLGASGKSVKIVVRGELYGDYKSPAQTVGDYKSPTTKGDVMIGPLPTEEAEIRQFHHNIYETARQAYQSQFGMEIEYLEPRLDRTVYMSADPEIYFNPDAMPFYGDSQPKEPIERVSISDESDSLMPGRTLNRTYRLNWLFIVENVLGKAMELPDADRQETLLMMVASACLAEGIPMARAIAMTLEHPILNSDELLVRKTFSAVYTVSLQEDYFEKHKPKPLASVPKETIQAMQTEIFLNANFELRKNLMTGVAEYREKYAEDQSFKPLTEEVRNDMTLRAMELGLKSWDRDVNRFIDSTRIEQYDPVNQWLDKLPQWDGHDHIKDLAARVPTSQPHWEMYLRMWLVGMVAQWRESDKQLTGNALTPLLIGRQGCGKTRFCKIILPPELRDYYNDKLNFKNEFDLNIALTSFAIINLDEFDKTSNGQQIVLKYLLSTSDVKFRPPYGKTIKQYRRYTSFIGTTNQQKPLVDPTGSRRFVCVGVTGNIDFSDTVDHRQLFAQALHLFNNKERFWLNDDEIATLIRENEPFQRLNDLVEMIGETFRKPKPSEQARWWSLKEISQVLAERYANYDPKTSYQKLGRALSDQQFDFETDRKTSGHYYKIVERGE